MTKVKTLLGTLKYVFIDGEGRNTAMQGEADRFRYVVSYVVPKDSEAHKHLKKLIDEEWEAYKKQFGIKGQPKTNGLKEPISVGGFLFSILTADSLSRSSLA